jgi:hypothetical protein
LRQEQVQACGSAGKPLLERIALLAGLLELSCQGGIALLQFSMAKQQSLDAFGNLVDLGL